MVQLFPWWMSESFLIFSGLCTFSLSFSFQLRKETWKEAKPNKPTPPTSTSISTPTSTRGKDIYNITSCRTQSIPLAFTMQRMNVSFSQFPLSDNHERKRDWLQEFGWALYTRAAKKIKRVAARKRYQVYWKEVRGELEWYIKYV